MSMTPEVAYLKDISIELRRINVVLNKIHDDLKERRVNDQTKTNSIIADTDSDDNK